MKLILTLGAIVLASLCAPVHAQTIPPVDHVFVNDPRVFNLSDAGGGYQLADGPAAGATLFIVQGPQGRLAASAVITDEALHSWGPVNLAGKLKIKPTGPLTMKLKGKGAGIKKMTVTGTYNAALQLMNVVVCVKTTTGQYFQWNDSFVPDSADLTGFSLHRIDVSTNAKNKIRGTHSFALPAISIGLATKDCETVNSGFNLQGKAVKIYGTYNPATLSFSVHHSRVKVGCGRIYTPGALVHVTTDNLFPRLY